MFVSVSQASGRCRCTESDSVCLCRSPRQVDGAGVLSLILYVCVGLPGKWTVQVY